MAISWGSLGAGGWCGPDGRDRRGRPWRLYGAREALVALPRVTRLFCGGAALTSGGADRSLGGSRDAYRLALASLVLLPPLSCRGTLRPRSARCVEAEPRRRGLAVLYGVNTLARWRGRGGTSRCRIFRYTRNLWMPAC